MAAAATLANRHRLANLAERIDMYRQIRFQEEEEEEMVEYVEAEEESYEQPPAKRARQQHHLQDDAENEDNDALYQVGRDDRCACSR